MKFHTSLLLVALTVASASAASDHKSAVVGAGTHGASVSPAAAASTSVGSTASPMSTGSPKAPLERNGHASHSASASSAGSKAMPSSSIAMASSSPRPSSAPGPSHTMNHKGMANNGAVMTTGLSTWIMGALIVPAAVVFWGL